MQITKLFRSRNRSAAPFARSLALICAGVLTLATGSSLRADVTVTTLGGGPVQGNLSPSGNRDGNTFTDSQFNIPSGMAFDSLGNLYIADLNNGKVRKVTAPGNKTTSTTSSFITGLNSPIAVAIDHNDAVYVLTEGDGSISKYDKFGTLVGTITTGLLDPTAMVLDGVYLFVTESGGSVKKISTDGVSVTVVGGGFNSPAGIAMLNNGVLAISESASSSISLLNPNTGATSLLVGSAGSGFADGPANLAKLNQPANIAKGPDGSLVVADRFNHRVRSVQTNGTTSTIYGVPSSQWDNTFYPGWEDGSSTIAAAREPFGVIVDTNGTIFVTEVFYHLLRDAIGTTFNAGGVGTTNVTGGVTNVVVGGVNQISFGFESGEDSSDFVGAAGQTFFAPVTLTTLAGQKIYTLQFSLIMSNLTAPAVSPATMAFDSYLMKPTTNAGLFQIIPPALFNGSSFTSGQFNDYVANLLGVGWFERTTNLYDTTKQSLIDFPYSRGGMIATKVPVGVFSFQISPAALNGQTYQISIVRPSAVADVTTGNSPAVALTAPVNGSLTSGPINSVKTITVGSRAYIAGDVMPFRFLNAGDFGEGFILNNDVFQIFQAAVYGASGWGFYPDPGSDFFDAMDTSDGSSATVFDGNDLSIDTIKFGDGALNVDDVYVAFRRSLDPFRVWYARYWSNGVRQAVAVPNVYPSSLTRPAPAPVLESFSSSAPDSEAAVPTVRPSVVFSADDAVVGANHTLQIPIRAAISGAYRVKVLMMSVSVMPLDGSPPLTNAVQFTPVAGISSPTFTSSLGPNNFAATWLNSYVSGIAGTNLVGTLTITLPANASASAAYAVHFDHMSASPNGLALFTTQLRDGLLTLSNREGSSWNDGISDSWRLRFFGTVSNLLSAAEADADGDGVSNWQEFKAGTLPLDAKSRLQLLGETLRTNSLATLRLRWPTVANKHYVIESSPSLFGTNWTVLSTNIIGDGTTREFIETNLTRNLQFYRVRLAP